MGYKMKRGNSAVPFKELGSSPAKMHKPGHEGKTKEVKGTSVFGKSPKNFVKDAVKNISGYNAIKGAYNKISGSKTKVGKKGMTKKLSDQTPEETHNKPMGRMMKESKKLVKKQGLKDSMKKQKTPSPKKKRTITDKTRMKAPYKKPVGPRAE